VVNIGLKDLFLHGEPAKREFFFTVTDSAVKLLINRSDSKSLHNNWIEEYTFIH
jgi:hypothetical protein